MARNDAQDGATDLSEWARALTDRFMVPTNIAIDSVLR